MDKALYSDVAVTWLGATGCLVYFRFLWRQRQGSAFAFAALFLFGTMAALLGIRGFFWIYSEPPGLGCAVFAAATLLPIAVTLFTEHLLRRHHSLPLKLIALGVSAIFFCINLIVPLAASLSLLIVFLAGLLLVLACNGWLLLKQAQSDLTQNEAQLAIGAALAALFALPLVATDFREELGLPVRLGALGPLILVYVLLHLSSLSATAVGTLSRLLTVLASAGILSLMFGIVTADVAPTLEHAWMNGLPLALAWMLLAAIVIQTRTLTTEERSQNFLRWLLLARLDSVEGMLASLKKLPLTAEHVILREKELAHYKLAQLFALAEPRREPLRINEARAWVKSAHAQKLDGAEQLVDLLERHEMSHALMIAQEPPLIVLLNLPHGANLPLAEVRAGVIQKIARRLVIGATHAD